MEDRCDSKEDDEHRVGGGGWDKPVEGPDGVHIVGIALWACHGDMVDRTPEELGSITNGLSNKNSTNPGD